MKNIDRIPVPADPPPVLVLPADENAVAVIPPPADPPPAEEAPPPSIHREVPHFQKCPVCWQQSGGVGNSRQPMPADLAQIPSGPQEFRCDRCGALFVHHFDFATLPTTGETVQIITR